MKALASVALPPAVATCTPTGPTPCAGAVAVIWVSLSTVKLVAGVPPRVTAVAPVSAEPWIVTLVPPAVEPVAGVMDVSAGAAT